MAASAEHIRALVRSYGSRDDDTFYAVALQVAAKAARQGHHRFADDVRRLVEAARSEARNTQVTSIAQPRGELGDLVVASHPEVSLRDLIVAPELRRQIQEAVTEQRQRHMLMQRGLRPIHRLLLEGPPGTGKTMTAAVIAHDLDVPLLTIRLDALVSKYLGETSGKLRVLFDAAASRRAVYLFDEFDALGGDRSGNDVGEARRIVSSFLLFLENAGAGAESVVVAATNHRAGLDPALFRRFDRVLRYSLPEPNEAIQVLKSTLGSLAADGIDWPTVGACAGCLSHAELVQAAETAAKRSLLSGREQVDAAALIETLKPTPRRAISDTSAIDA